VPKAANAASAVLCATDRAGIQPMPQPKPADTDFDRQPYVALVCRFDGLHSVLRIIRGLLLICRSRRDGRLSWPSWLIHSGQLYKQSGYLLTIDRAQVWERPPDKDRRPNH